MGPGGDPTVLIKIWQEAFPEGGGEIFVAMAAVGVIALLIAAIRLRKKR